ncbi:ABC transporter substrate-binding protein [Gryllotalpicola koreensis]|uniref:ABC transporter substrate-binding protein n=1 Tax=Gryllotalpicola koreensis TaxID=993086 RepID=A0ABP8ACT9_9MICO
MAHPALRNRSVRRLGTALIAAAIALGLTACNASTAPAASTSTSTSTKTLKIGVFQIAEASVLDEIATSFESELTAKLAPTKVTFDTQNAQGDQSLIASIASTMASSDDDAFAVIGTPAVIAMAQKVSDKPIFALAMGDPVGSGVADSLDKPGRNVTGSVDYVDPALLLKPLMEISPDVTRLGTVYDPSNENLTVWVKALKKAAKAYPGLKIVEATITGSGDVSTAARSLVGRVDAELIGPDATVLAAADAVGAAAASNGIPVYLSGGDATVSGVFASIGPDYSVSGKLGADVAAKVLDGADAAKTPFAKPTGVLINVNKATMGKLGITLPSDLAKTATVQ